MLKFKVLKIPTYIITVLYLNLCNCTNTWCYKSDNYVINTEFPLYFISKFFPKVPIITDYFNTSITIKNTLNKQDIKNIKLNNLFLNITKVFVENNADIKLFKFSRLFPSVRFVQLNSTNNYIFLKDIIDNYKNLESLDIYQKEPISYLEMLNIQKLNNLHELRIHCPIKDNFMFFSLLPINLNSLALSETQMDFNNFSEDFTLSQLKYLNIFGDYNDYNKFSDKSKLNYKFFHFLKAPNLKDLTTYNMYYNDKILIEIKMNFKLKHFYTSQQYNNIDENEKLFNNIPKLGTN